MKKLIIILILVAAAVGVTYIVKPSLLWAPAENSECPQKIKLPIVSPEVVKYFGKNDKNALELLEQTTSVEFKQYDYGAFVESINGVKPDSKHFWKLSVDGQDAQVGADKLITKDCQIITWNLEEIKP